MIVREITVEVCIRFINVELMKKYEWPWISYIRHTACQMVGDPFDETPRREIDIAYNRAVDNVLESEAMLIKQEGNEIIKDVRTKKGTTFSHWLKHGLGF